MSEKNKQKTSKNESRINQAKNKGALEFSLVLVKKKQEKT